MAIVITSEDKLYHFCAKCSAEVYRGDKYCHECGDALTWSKARPDVVVVVRCKDCIHQKYMRCLNEVGVLGELKNDDYCSYGERR